MQPESALLRDIVVRAGVPPAALIEESHSKTTREQATLIGPILRDRHSRRFVLVTSPMHMRRSLAVFRAAEFDPVASVAPVRSEQVGEPPWLIPNDESFALSDAAVYDYLALMYYWSRGWMKLPRGQVPLDPASSAMPSKPGPPAAAKPRLAPAGDALTQNAYRRPRSR